MERLPSCAHLVKWTLAAATMLSLCSKGIMGLQCFHCSGDTSSDTNNCFEPIVAETFIHSCKKGEMCEKRVIRMTDRFKKIERGCSGNCKGRNQIYTTDFHAHCCDGELCNSASRSIPTIVGLSSIAIFTVWLTRS